MKREDIISMAVDAGYNSLYENLKFDDFDIDRFAALVAAAERDACAKLCDERIITKPEYPHDQFYNQAAIHCAKAIRYRGDA